MVGTFPGSSPSIFTPGTLALMLASQAPELLRAGELKEGVRVCMRAGWGFSRIREQLSVLGRCALCGHLCHCACLSVHLGH